MGTKVLIENNQAGKEDMLINKNKNSNFKSSAMKTKPNGKVLGWNCRSASNPHNIKLIINEALKNNIFIVCLQETYSHESRDHFERFNEHFEWSQSMYTTSAAGVAIGVRKDIIKNNSLKIIFKDQKIENKGRILFIEFDDHNDNHYVVGNIYFPADNKKSKRKTFIQNLPWKMMSQSTVVCMDSNMTINEDEHIFTTSIAKNKIEKDAKSFSEFLKMNKLICLNDKRRYMNQPIEATWIRRKKTGQITCEKCIDRMIIQEKNLELIFNYETYDWDHLNSDHRPIVMSFTNINTKKTIKARVQTQYLIENEKLNKKIQKFIDKTLDDEEQMNNKPETFNKLMVYIEKTINDHHKRNIAHRKKKYKNCLNKTIKKIGVRISNVLKQNIILNKNIRTTKLEIKIHNLREERKTKYEKTKKKIIEELITKEQSNEIDIDDAFKRYKPTVTTNIPGVIVEKEGIKEVSYEHKHIDDQFTSFWQVVMNDKLNTNKNSIEYKENHKKIFENIKENENAKLINANLNLEDIDNAIKHMKNNSPGPYRLDLKIFTALKGLKELTLKIWNDRNQHSLPELWNTALIKLLHKGGEPTEPKNYRPVSLLCVSYKLITKAIEMRMSSVMNELIVPEQRGYMKNRQLSDAMATLLAAADNAKKANTKLAMINFDIRKAFDSLNRDYLFEAMKKIGFHDTFINDIKLLYKNNSCQLILNGKLGKKFEITSGIRQGDALSVLLYSIAINPIFLMVKKEFIKGFQPKLYGNHKFDLKAPRLKKTTIHGIQYVDDVTAFITEPKDIERWFNVWNSFGIVSGQKIDKNKTVTFMINDFNNEDLEVLEPDLKQTIKESIVKDGEIKKILGFHVDFKMKISNETWKKSLNGVIANVQAWKRLDLPLELRAKMINAQVHSFLNK